MAESFRLSVVTPEREVLAVVATFVALPAFDGEMGILPRRAPLLVQLGSGLLRVDPVDGPKQTVFVSGGFAQMVEDRLTVLSQEARAVGELSRGLAAESLRAAQQLPADSEQAWTKKQHALDRARAVARHAPGGD